MTYSLVKLKRPAVMDDPYMEGTRFWGKRLGLTWEIAVHPAQSERIILNYPGYRGAMDGYNEKYVRLADFLQEKGFAVLRSPNTFWEGFTYERSVQEDLRRIINYAFEHAAEICGSADPKIGLMGTSAGAGAIAAVAHDYPSIDKLLLLAPAGDAGEAAIARGIGLFRGDVSIVVGENDEAVGVEAGRVFYGLALRANSRRLAVLPSCDHNFTGERNGRILSKAPLWAFAGDETFPSPEGGIWLYD